MLIGNSKFQIKLGETTVSEYDDATTNIVYLRYNIGGADDKEPIVKIDSTGTTTRYFKTYDTWANRATATYTMIVRGE